MRVAEEMVFESHDDPTLAHYFPSASAGTRYSRLIRFKWCMDHVEKWLPGHIPAMETTHVIRNTLNFVSLLTPIIRHIQRSLPRMEGDVPLESIVQLDRNAIVETFALSNSPEHWAESGITPLVDYLRRSLSLKSCPHEFNLTFRLILPTDTTKTTFDNPSHPIYSFFMTLSFSGDLSPKVPHRIMDYSMDLIHCISSRTFRSVSLGIIYDSFLVPIPKLLHASSFPRHPTGNTFWNAYTKTCSV